MLINRSSSSVMREEKRSEKDKSMIQDKQIHHWRTRMVSGKRASRVVLTFKALDVKPPNAVETENCHEKQTNLGENPALSLFQCDLR